MPRMMRRSLANYTTFHISSGGLNDMAPFRLSGRQFGIFESRGICQNEPSYQTRPFIALFAGGLGPVALYEEQERCYRFMGPCYVQGLEDESACQALNGEESVEFTLI